MFLSIMTIKENIALSHLLESGFILFLVYNLMQDEEEEDEVPSTMPNEQEEPDENHCSGPSPNHVNLESRPVCNLETTNSKLDANSFLEDSSKKSEIMNDPASPLPNPSEYVPHTPVVSLFEITDMDDVEKAEKPIAEQIRDSPKTPIVSSDVAREPYNFLEESSKKSEIMKDPASLLHNPSECVPDTPVVSLSEITDKDDGEKAEKPIAEQIRDTPKTPTVSSDEAREPDQLQNENCDYVPETPSISFAQEILPSRNCDKVDKCVLSETDHCGYVPESPILPPDQLCDKEADGTETEQVDMQIDDVTKEVLNGEKEESISAIVAPGTVETGCARVSSVDIVSSDNDDDEGSVDKNQVKDELPRKKRRRVAVPPEAPRRVTRSSLRGSNLKS
jgi:hypothetical protein